MTPKLPEDHEALLNFLYLAPAGLVQTTADGEVTLMNPRAAQLLLALAPNDDLTNLFESLAELVPDLRRLVATGTTPGGTLCDGRQLQAQVGPPGARRTQVLSLTLVRIDAARLMVLLQDVTEQVRCEQLLKQQEAWLAAIMTDITDYALIRLDADGLIDAWNPSIERLTGHGAETVMGRPWSMFHPAGAITPDRTRDLLAEADANGWSLDEGWRVRADGARFRGSAMIAPLQRPADDATAAARPASAGPDRAVGGYSLVVRDISDKREASAGRQRDYACDHLTGIANRRSFFEAAKLEVARYRRAPRPVTLVLIDVDHFKEINDRLGHPAGDAALRHFARVAEATLRETDVFARIGGEEFAVLMPATDAKGAVLLAERLRAATAATPCAWEGGTIPFTVSCGVAALTDAVLGIDGLVRRADRALLAAKRAGRDRVCSAAEDTAIV